jgi:formylglycine-generating enzyme required for sulfatase activity
VLTFWKPSACHLPRTAHSIALNRSANWELKSRLDAKGVEQVWVPPGCFEMGSSLWEDFSTRANETPRHTTCISAGFWLDRYEVTNESFLQFAREGGFKERRYWSAEGWKNHADRPNPFTSLKDFAADRQPRVKISWYEAEAYAAWRGGRLPTEAQWEWAARGPKSHRYPWGSQIRVGLCNMDRPDLRCTRPVGSYPQGRSWCGADDMAGNVAEWVADGYEPEAYRSAALVDPFTPPKGNLRVLRGGSWGGITGGSASDVRSARRAPYFVELRKNSHGARIIHPGT